MTQNELDRVTIQLAYMYKAGATLGYYGALGSKYGSLKELMRRTKPTVIKSITDFIAQFEEPEILLPPCKP